MNNIKIFTDSTADLSQELINKNRISLIPLYLTIRENTYRDGVDIKVPEMYKLVEKYNQLPLTGAPSPEDYYQAFKPYIEEGQDIIYIGLSSKISSAYQNAVIAADRFKNGRIAVIDSANLSTGIGLLVMKAVDFVSQGIEFTDIVKNIKKYIPQVRTQFVISTLEYLHKGGRCSGIQRYVGNILKIRPVVQVKKGKMILAEKTRGNRNRIVNHLLNMILVKWKEADLKRVFITHSLCDKYADYLQTVLTEKTDFEDILITNAGCVISSHCGPGTIGILYIKK